MATLRLGDTAPDFLQESTFESEVESVNKELGADKVDAVK